MTLISARIDFNMNALTVVRKVVFRNLGEFFANLDISSMCQLNSVTAAIANYFGGTYQQEQFENMATFIDLLSSRLRNVENQKIDKEFLESKDGKRIIGKIFRDISRDNRIEKLTAMANLTVNLFQKSKLTIDEREVYVDILDNLNVLQLSILQRAMLEIKQRAADLRANPHKGFSWEKVHKEYETKGVTGALLLQSIRVLESNGLVNQNNAPAQDEDQTHFVTFFGEQFYAFIADREPTENSNL